MSSEIISTSAEVWAVIRARHNDDLGVYASCSDPDGINGGRTGRMYTAYGFKGADYPLMAAETTWDIDDERSYKRHNEKHEYWLFVNQLDDE